MNYVLFFFAISQHRIWVNFYDSQAPALWENWEKIQVSRRLFCNLSLLHSPPEPCWNFSRATNHWHFMFALWLTLQNDSKRAEKCSTVEFHDLREFFFWLRETVNWHFTLKEKKIQPNMIEYMTFFTIKATRLAIQRQKNFKLKLMLVSCTKNVFGNCESCLGALYVCSSHEEVHHATRGLVNYIDMPCTECQKRSTIDVTHVDSPTSQNFNTMYWKSFLSFRPPSLLHTCWPFMSDIQNSFGRACIMLIGRAGDRKSSLVRQTFPILILRLWVSFLVGKMLFCDLFRLLVLSSVYWHSRTRWQER